MSRAELVSAVAEEAGMSPKEASEAVEAITEIITREIAAGGAVTLPGIGKFYVRERPSRMVRNPATGEQIRKDADSVVKVTIAKSLKDAAGN